MIAKKPKSGNAPCLFFPTVTLLKLLRGLAAGSLSLKCHKQKEFLCQVKSVAPLAQYSRVSCLWQRPEQDASVK